MKISQIKIIQDNDDGTFTEVGAVMPTEIASHIRQQAVFWDDDWLATFSEVTEFNEAVKTFKVQRIGTEPPKQ